MNYSKDFLFQFKVDSQKYTYAKINELTKVPLIRKGSSKLYFALIRAEECIVSEFQCSTHQCDLKSFYSCVGVRCLPGGRKDNKPVVFKIEYIYQVD